MKYDIKNAKHVTTEEIRALTESRIEDENIPAQVLEWITANQSKGVRANNVPNAPLPDYQHGNPCNYRPDRWRIVKQYGMTHLETFSHSLHAVKTPGWSFLIAHREKHVEIPTPEEFQERNRCHYSAAQERNEQRRAILANGNQTEAIAEAVNTFIDAWNHLQSVTEKHPEIYAIRKLAGME